MCGHLTSTQALADVLVTSELTSLSGASVADASEVELSRACEARLLYQSLTQTLSDSSRSVSLSCTVVAEVMQVAGP